MAVDVSAPLPELELAAAAIVRVDTGDAAAIITRLVVHVSQDAPELVNDAPLTPPLLAHEQLGGIEAPGLSPQVLLALPYGTFAGWATVLSVVLLGWLLYRGQAGTAIGVLRDANAVLEHKVGELERQLAAARRDVAALEAKTDVSIALAPVGAAIAAHEANAQARAERTLTVLALIAERLGPELESTGKAA